MALRALMLRKKIDLKKKEADELRKKLDALKQREDELAVSIEEVATEDEQRTVEDAVNELVEERAGLGESVNAVDAAIRELETELAGVETESATDEARNMGNENHEERGNINMSTTNRALMRMSLQDRTALVQRDDVKGWLDNVRSAIREKRAINNVGLTIAPVLLGLLRENVEDYSKLLKHVTVRNVSGDATQLIMGAVPEAIWTDCCANLNELTLGFNDLEMACYKVGGYFAVCNANIEDSDLDLLAELLIALGQAIGIALDKAILYGRNSNTTQKMPQGIVSRLVQTEAPSGYPATARPWVDLHTTNVITIPDTATGLGLFQQFALAAANAKGKYARGPKVWVMNETTYSIIQAQAMNIDASGAIVSGVNGTMPVIGGAIEVLSFLPDNVIIGGYFDLYILAERAGQKFATSEHVRFLQDQTVMKGTARYDGAPAIAEAFVAVGIGGVTPTSAMDFPVDTANT